MKIKETDVLFLCNTHGIGGAQLNATMLAREFSKRGRNVAVGFLFERESMRACQDVDTFIVSKSKPKTISQWIKFFNNLIHQIKVRRPKVIIGFQPASNILGALAAKLLGNCRMVATQRNPASEQSKMGGLLDKIIGGTDLYDANVAVSNSVKNTFLKYPRSYRNKLRVIHNGTPPLEAIFDTKDECRKSFRMAQNHKIIGCIGRLHEQKNVAFAIKVHATLKDDCHLYIAGDGPEEGRLKELAAQLEISQRVHFLGTLDGEDVTRFYRALDVLLFCSIYEGFGRVLVEAMSQGVPIIASDIDTAREVAGDAALFCPFECMRWTIAISSVLDSAKIKDEMVLRGISRANLFDFELMTENYIRVAEEVGH